MRFIKETLRFCKLMLTFVYTFIKENFIALGRIKRFLSHELSEEEKTYLDNKWGRNTKDTTNKPINHWRNFYDTIYEALTQDTLSLLILILAFISGALLASQYYEYQCNNIIQEINENITNGDFNPLIASAGQPIHNIVLDAQVPMFEGGVRLNDT